MTDGRYVLPRALVLHFFHTYFSTPIHPNLGLPVLLPPSGSSCSDFCTVLSQSILTNTPRAIPIYILQLQLQYLEILLQIYLFIFIFE
jgi:hypothetical protein